MAAKRRHLSVVTERRAALGVHAREPGREAANRCHGEMADVIERYLPVIGTTGRDGEALSEALVAFRRRAPGRDDGDRRRVSETSHP